MQYDVGAVRNRPEKFALSRQRAKVTIIGTIKLSARKTESIAVTRDASGLRFASSNVSTLEELLPREDVEKMPA